MTGPLLFPPTQHKGKKRSGHVRLVLNSDKHNETYKSEDSVEFGNETIDVSDSDVEIVNNDSSGAAPSQRSSCLESNEHEGDHEITETISGPTQPQTIHC